MVVRTDNIIQFNSIQGLHDKDITQSLPYHTEAGCFGQAVLMCFFDLGQQHSSVMTDRLNVEN